jgi:hypothetical protein
MILAKKCLDQKVIEEYIYESQSNPQKYTQLFNEKFTKEIQKLFYNKNVYAIYTAPKIYENIEIQLVIEKYNTMGVSVKIKTTPFVSINKLVNLRESNMDFRELLKLSFYILQNKFKDITDMDCL